MSGKKPERWNEPIIQAPFATLTKKQVLDYYSNPQVKNELMKAVGHREVVVRQSFEPGKNVLRRKDPLGNFIKFETPKAFKQLVEKRLSEVHPTFGRHTNILLADIDPQKNVPWKKTKAIAETVAKTMKTHPDVKKVEVQFSGGRGFYVRGIMDKAIKVDQARALTQKVLHGISKRPDVTFGVTRNPSQIRIDTTPLKFRGSVRAPMSLNASTGLVSAPVTMAKLPKVEKSDFTIQKVIKKAAALPARERVEVFGRQGDKYLTGLFSGQGVGVYGGGVDPGEDPAEAAAREYLEEAGYKLKNMQPIDVPPFRQRWLKSQLEHKKIQERAKEFPGGTLTRAFIGDIVGKPQKAIDATDHWLKDVKPRSLEELLGIQRQAVGGLPKASPDRRRTEYRLRVLEALANKTAAKMDVIDQEATEGDQGVRYRREGEAETNLPEHPSGDRMHTIKDKAGRIATRLKVGLLMSPLFAQADDILLPLFRQYQKKKEAKPSQLPILPKQAADKGEFAPGIPKKRVTRPIPDIQNKAWTLAIQQHNAFKAGPHWDFRLVDPETHHAHSFAVPKMKFPAKGETVLGIQQPTHKSRYALKFEGDIPRGVYGGGSVKMHLKEPVEVIKANANRIVMKRPDGDKLVLFRMNEKKWGIRKLD